MDKNRTVLSASNDKCKRLGEVYSSELHFNPRGNEMQAVKLCKETAMPRRWVSKTLKFGITVP